MRKITITKAESLIISGVITYAFTIGNRAVFYKTGHDAGEASVLELVYIEVN